MIKLVAAAAVFVGGVYAGLALAAVAAREAGCPAARKPVDGKERGGSTVEDLLSTLGAVRQRTGRTEPPGSAS